MRIHCVSLPHTQVTAVRTHALQYGTGPAAVRYSTYLAKLSTLHGDGRYAL